MLRKLGPVAAVAALALLAAGAVACGSGSADKGPAGSAPTTAAASPTRTAATAPTSAATPAATQGGGNPAGGGTTRLALVAVNLLFDKTELKAAPGAVEITLDNEDGGVPHNIQVFKGDDASGESVGMSQLTAGPAKETLTLNLAKGDYFYQCDAHPTTMTGKLDVE